MSAWRRLFRLWPLTCAVSMALGPFILVPFDVDFVERCMTWEFHMGTQTNGEKKACQTQLSPACRKVNSRGECGLLFFFSSSAFLSVTLSGGGPIRPSPRHSRDISLGRWGVLPDSNYLICSRTSQYLSVSHSNLCSLSLRLSEQQFCHISCI